MTNIDKEREAFEDDAELLPCPFCGSDDISSGEAMIEHEHEPNVIFKQTGCLSCGALGSETREADIYGRECDKSWNTRAKQHSGEAVYQLKVGHAHQSWVDTDLSNYKANKAENKRIVYLSPQQPQQVADALEKVISESLKLRLGSWTELENYGKDWVESNQTVVDEIVKIARNLINQSTQG